MSDTKQIVEAVIAQAIEQTNEFQEEGEKLKNTPECPITGPRGTLDSMGVVNFVLAVEDALRAQTESQLILFDEELIADPDGPFENIGKMANHIAHILSQAE